MIRIARNSDVDRFRELLLHAREGSPIAMETVRSHLRIDVLNATPSVLLALAERLLEVREQVPSQCA
jgi:hypothetical protein